ncbi:hypothetical protein [Acidovorax sp. sic0104]|uniref:hypothetical protein n=1 Tax=Acidovorax sp. sic0104 TaxID=2854784 RepID=UPI001C475EBF|nr:hypothetical protein [Acidovorax sp. sic0104]MBV7542001.1 hypothetical protein [Acidovorax sp. sic0104]
MTLADTIEALRPLQTPHATAHGERPGFLMADAARALGGLAQASNSLALLMSVDLVVSAPLFVGNEVHTVFSLADAEPLTVH